MCELQRIAKFPPTQTVQKAEEASHVQFFDRVEEIPAMMQVPTMQEAQKTVEVHRKNS